MNFTIVQQWVSWLWENIEVLGTLSYLWYHRKYVYKTFIFTPLAGGNGKIQMDELAKGLIIAICVWSINKDANRTHEWAYFSDAYYLSLFGAFFAIASIKPIAAAITANATNKTDETEQGHGQV
jgi:hypothetical protein